MYSNLLLYYDYIDHLLFNKFQLILLNNYLNNKFITKIYKKKEFNKINHYKFINFKINKFNLIFSKKNINYYINNQYNIINYLYNNNLYNKNVQYIFF
jgi:hypothetical protein